MTTMGANYFVWKNIWLIFNYFLRELARLEYQNTSLLVQAMLCTAANTSPVEKGYTILQMVISLNTEIQLLRKI